MALFRCGTDEIAEQVIFDQVGVTTQQTIPYDGTTDIKIAAYCADKTTAEYLQSKTSAEVLSSTSAAPFWNLTSSGNQGGKLYYDNGNIIFETTKQYGMPLLVIWYDI